RRGDAGLVRAEVLGGHGDAGQDGSARIGHAADDVGAGDLSEHRGVMDQAERDGGGDTSTSEHVLLSFIACGSPSLRFACLRHSFPTWNSSSVTSANGCGNVRSDFAAGAV